MDIIEVLVKQSDEKVAQLRDYLAEGRVDVVEVPGRPGAYQATVFLRPHFQMEELTTSIRLVAELPASAA